MAIVYPVYDFPNLPVKAQLFHVPGQALDGGYTSGGARIMSPEPGGRATLEIQLSLHTNEWGNPAISWLMSKINGEIFRVPLTKTPQIARTVDDTSTIGRNSVPWDKTGLMNYSPWDNNQNWDDDGNYIEASVTALKGTQYISIESNDYNLQRGHVIGVGDNAYMIDNIVLNDDETLTLRIMPPLRKTVAPGDMIYIRPYFLGTIANGEEFRNVYDIENVGHIQPNRLILREVILT